mgnify:CR=1 FL=1
MKVNIKFIKQQRQNRLWSQEQLAEISGLSNRTIQRIESTGNASTDSIQALCSIFDCDLDTLKVPESVSEFSSYSHTQLSWYMYIVFFIAGVFTINTAIAKYTVSAFDENSLLFLVLGITAVFLIVVSVLFYSLTITVNRQNVTWYFGPTFWKRQVEVADIAECHIVRNSLLNGFGIRTLADGWLYNVSGLLAVELKLKSGSVVRLGTDEPEYLKNAIEATMAQQSLK